jgi:hypothetical protein
MNKQQIIDHYQKEIDNAETPMEKNLLEAEMEHKIKLLDLGEETNYSKKQSDSDFECIACGS